MSARDRRLARAQRSTAERAADTLARAIADELIKFTGPTPQLVEDYRQARQLLDTLDLVDAAGYRFTVTP